MANKAGREFWSEIVTERSWQVLLGLKGFDFILIGGWAAYLWTRMHKSKDVDIVLKDFGALDHLKQNYTLRKNERLRKYEIKIGEIDVDIYVPFFSKLAIPPEELEGYTSKLEGITVVVPEALLVLKQAAEIERRGSLKGEKDAIDMMALLLTCDIDFGKYCGILKKYGHAGFSQELLSMISNFDLKNLRYLGVDPRTFKLKKLEILRRLREAL